MDECLEHLVVLAPEVSEQKEHVNEVYVVVAHFEASFVTCQMMVGCPPIAVVSDGGFVLFAFDRHDLSVGATRSK